MTLKAFLDRVIDDGVAAARESYKNKPQKLEGAVAGFEACRGKTVFELRQQLDLAAKAADVARAVNRENYWYLRCYHAEIEWVCNVVSACLQNQGLDTIVIPTARGYLKAAEIVGVKSNLTLKEFIEQSQN
jgi:hypothetical protein